MYMYIYISYIHICVRAYICDFIIDHLVYNHSLQCMANYPNVTGSRITQR